MYFSIVSEHDSNIGEGPPNIPSEEYQEEKSESEGDISERFIEIRGHGEMLGYEHITIFESLGVRIFGFVILSEAIRSP